MIRFAKKPVTPPKRPKSCTHLAIARLAETIRETCLSGASLDSEALARAGFSASFIATHGDKARNLARRLSVRVLA